MVGFVDDRVELRKAIIQGRRVLGAFADLDRLLVETRAEVLVISFREHDPDRLRAVLHVAMGVPVPIKVVHPRGDDPEAVTIGDVALEEVLGRPQRHLDHEPLRRTLKGCVVLVTGAGGSIGSELCRQLVRQPIRRLILVERSEFALYRIVEELETSHHGRLLDPRLLDAADRDMIDAVFSAEEVDIVYHAAAYKHVPLCESNPIAAIHNNVGALWVTLTAADRHGVGRFVLISTDKAVRPTSTMGLSKRLCEMVGYRFPWQTTFVAVRFGNVLGSSGSVVPKFLDQIARGGPVTVTDPEMTRYFMLVSEAVELVLHAGYRGDGRRLFALDMGEPVSVMDLARQLIYLCGRVPENDIKIATIGVRPGEKLREELFELAAEPDPEIPALLL